MDKDFPYEKAVKHSIRSLAMAVQYQIDGDIFREIKTNWLCASINEFLIKARQLDTTQAGGTVEYFQLNDGRIFTRLVPISQVVDNKGFSNRPRNMQPSLREHSLT
jgi:hypothetical protein